MSFDDYKLTFYLQKVINQKAFFRAFDNFFSKFSTKKLFKINNKIFIPSDGETVLNALKQVFYDPPSEPCDCEPQTDLLGLPFSHSDNIPRRTSGASSVSGKK